MISETRRWWFCRNCDAVNDGGTLCWNCHKTQRKSKNIPWCVMGTDICTTCGLYYVTWETATDHLGVCPLYLEHNGRNAYYPPMLPFAFILEANGYEYDKEQDKVVKR
jgi:hypothetical protein